MTTPISSFHIVMGKLFSKLLQIILLLAISLPLLAVVRVFGGVPWLYLLSSLCITLTAVIFAGSVSLFFSINNRRAYVVIIKAVVALGVLYVFVPTLAGALLSSRWLFASGSPTTAFPQLTAIFLHSNPFGAMSMNTAIMVSPAAPAGWFHWPAHCALMLGISALLTALSVRIVRKVALRQATGQIETGLKFRRKRKPKKSTLASAKPQERHGTVRRVKGPPVLWKEIRAPMIRGRDGRNSFIGLMITIIALFITYATSERANCLDEGFVHVTYVLMFLFIGSMFTMVLSATCITSEKESRAWPIMLATSMDDWHILLGKAGGVFRRCLPIWLLLAGHIVLFIFMRYIHPIALIHALMLMAGLVPLLTGIGLYFSARCRRTTSAVVANFALAIVLWAIIPAVLGVVSEFTDRPKALEMYVSANPAAQATVIMSGAGGERNARTKFSGLRYDWPDRYSNWHKPGPTTGVLAIYALIHLTVGGLFAAAAKRRFRRNIF